MSGRALANYSNPDNDPRGLWKSDPAHAQAGHGVESQFYTVVAPNGKRHELPSGRCWIYNEKDMNEAIKDNRIWFGKDGNGVPRVKTYLYAKDRGLTPETMIFAKDGNNIKIKVSDGNNKFTLKRKNNGKLTKFYYKSGYQTIGTFEFPYEQSKEYDVKSFYGKIIIDKLDDDTKNKDKSSSEASLEGAEYGLYDKDNNLLQTKKTDKNGTIKFDNLPKNNYRIKEISPSVGYTKSPVTSSTFIGTGTREVVIKSFEKIIKNKIYITKVLDDPINNTCTPEEGILFYVFDILGNHIMDLVTDKNGNIEFALPYGTYTLRQISTKDGVDKVEDRIIEVTKDGVIQKIALVNHFLPKEKVPEEKKEEIKEEVLPNTGKHSFPLYIMLLSISSLITIYEKSRN